MNSNLWIKEIMSLKVSYMLNKDITKILILIYIANNKLFNKNIKFEEIERYVYEFYIDNPNISKENNNSIIRNINKYNIEDLYSIIKNALYEWKNDYPHGCLNFNNNELYVSVDDVSDETYNYSMMVAKMLYRKATNKEFNYSANIDSLTYINSYNLDLINSTRLVNRVLEDINYCCCCDALDDLYIINLSDSIKEINNPLNYITVCKKHYDLFKQKYYIFDKAGNIEILKPDKSLNCNMHLSYKVMKTRKKYLIR